MDGNNNLTNKEGNMNDHGRYSGVQLYLKGNGKKENNRKQKWKEGKDKSKEQDLLDGKP